MAASSFSPSGNDTMVSPFELLGFITAAFVTLKLAKWLKLWYSSPLDVRQLGRWALVTGSTDGIGKAFAFALASKGLNVVLVSRSFQKLKRVADEIEQKHLVQTKVITVDFKDNAEDYVPAIRREIEGLDIGVLVNNVGMLYDYPEEFLAVAGGYQKIRDLISVNITSMNVMTRLCLPPMVGRGCGAVINIGSLAGVSPGPLVAAYAATKAYVDKFSTTLHQEYARKGITVQCVHPGFVVSNMSRDLIPDNLPGFLAPEADKFVRSCLGRLGISTVTAGYWAHDLLWILPPLILPESVMASQAHDMMVQAKKKALNALKQ